MTSLDFHLKKGGTQYETLGMYKVKAFVQAQKVVHYIIEKATICLTDETVRHELVRAAQKSEKSANNYLIYF